MFRLTKLNTISLSRRRRRWMRKCIEDAYTYDSTRDPFIILPLEVVVIFLLPYLSIYDVVTCSGVSKYWRLLMAKHTHNVHLLSSNTDIGVLIPIIQKRNIAVMRWLSVRPNFITCINADGCNLNKRAVARIRYCPNLQRLMLGGGYNEVSEALCYIAKQCPLLHSISLVGCSDLNDNDVTILSTHCKLVVVDLAGCSALTNVGITSLARKCGTSLRRLRIAYCKLLTGGALISLGNHCTRLEEIDLRMDVMDSFSVAYFLAHSPHIHAFSFWTCKTRNILNTSAILALAAAKVFTLQLPIQSSMPVDSLSYIFQLSSRHLTVLNVYGCRQINDIFIHVLSQNCPDLGSLNLCSCPNISDDALLSLSKECRRLVRVDVSFCSNISHRSIVALLWHNAGLMEWCSETCIHHDKMRSTLTNNAYRRNKFERYSRWKLSSQVTSAPMPVSLNLIPGIDVYNNCFQENIEENLSSNPVSICGCSDAQSRNSKLALPLQLKAHIAHTLSNNEALLADVALAWITDDLIKWHQFERNREVSTVSSNGEQPSKRQLTVPSNQELLTHMLQFQSSYSPYLTITQSKVHMDDSQTLSISTPTAPTKSHYIRALE